LANQRPYPWHAIFSLFLPRKQKSEWCGPEPV